MVTSFQSVSGGQQKPSVYRIFSGLVVALGFIVGLCQLGGLLPIAPSIPDGPTTSTAEGNFSTLVRPDEVCVHFIRID